MPRPPWDEVDVTDLTTKIETLEDAVKRSRDWMERFGIEVFEASKSRRSVAQFQGYLQDLSDRILEIREEM